VHRRLRHSNSSAEYRTDETTLPVPEGPSGANVDDNIRAAAGSFKDALEPKWYAGPDSGEDPLGKLAGHALWFFNQVKDKGPCDYKYRDPAVNEGRRSRYEPFGNFKVGQAGFQLKKIKYTGEADFVGNRRVVYITPGTLSGGEGDRVLERSRNGYAVTALNELMHHARNSGVYTDRMLAEAAFKLLTPDERLQHPLPKSKDVITNSKYFHPLFNLHCRSVTGE